MPHFLFGGHIQLCYLHLLLGLLALCTYLLYTQESFLMVLKELYGMTRLELGQLRTRQVSYPLSYCSSPSQPTLEVSGSVESRWARPTPCTLKTTPRSLLKL